MAATAVIDIGLVKDHAICGYTGALKNMTHGTINNPEAHHAHYANPQIAMLYAHPIMKSRVRLHIADAFRLMYDRGPLLKDPNTIVPHGAVYAFNGSGCARHARRECRGRGTQGPQNALAR